ncbi:CRISPR-associated helicase Cas3' [Methanoplanus sp. FWC-SCC4]|uniref:CRISPR-associated helicase Cas3 n=1 Tax=Methanochimaera problematica TaxID=2609417 RepID=A0AA97I4M7_9EURY|nr:CRISPR-associated helicase Cas3' [Methanoplanus sp. FWC-SCC4]WOF16664.1 CRISPR-associated helicase Cas3' [Methanoplanus sp. FWC-SCC4]
MYYAHTTENANKSDWQTLKDHLESVAQISSGFADDFGSGRIAYAGGLLHDIGKYSGEFQNRLEGRRIRVDHSTAGAVEAKGLYNPSLSRILEYIIAGHHGGILNYGTPESGLECRIKNAVLHDYSAYKYEVEPPDLNSFNPTLVCSPTKPGFTISFYIRMLYSCLVDADSLDTERFANPEKSALRGKYESFESLFEKFENRMRDISLSCEDTPVNQSRNEIYQECRRKAELKPGIFTLSVPTGGGKTLSSMAFALLHLKKYDLKRIFYVIPYTSIIEQNAKVFREIFGSGNVLEHHSNYDPGKEGFEDVGDFNQEDMLKLSSENWDMPVVVTTNVQFFESLFSNKRSRCRKIHNLSGSVIILDEAQMLPTKYLKPCLSALSELVRNYGSTVVICTATQPKIGDFLDEDIQPVEIMESPKELYEHFRRVHVNNLGDISDEELSERITGHHQALCVVNTRKHARLLYQRITESEISKDDGSCFHLSAGMCPVHRREQLEKIRSLLKEGKPCRVISTQLIEAGVDVDFPFVYRARTGIDSIAQAAGRCNREGKRDLGEIFVFRSTEDYGKATSWQSRTAEIGEMIFREFEDPLSPEAVSEYFKKLYFNEGDEGLDKKKILLSLEKRVGECAFPFGDVSDDFRIIDENTKDIIIPFDDSARKAIKEIQKIGFPENYGRKLQGYSVSVYPHEFKALNESNALELIADRYYILTSESLYSEKTGLLRISSDEFNGALLIA